MKRLKFKYFNNDTIIFHERDIIRERGHFKIFNDKYLKQQFMIDLTKLIDKFDFTVISSIINKNKLKEIYKTPSNPYDLSLKFCMERTYRFLEEKNNLQKTSIILEKRGNKEDKELEETFKKINNGTNFLSKKLCFDLHLTPKNINSDGMQIADLIARPIGRHYLKPNENNRAYEVIKQKIRKHNGSINGGLKIFPY